MSSPPWLWLLNPDAEVELARAARGLAYAPSLSLRRAMSSRAALFSDLVRGDDWMFAHDLKKSALKNRRARILPWCPTPQVRQILRDAGAVVPRACSAIPIVHDKTFLQTSGLHPLPGRRVIHTHAEWQGRRAFADEAWKSLGIRGGSFRVKRPFGFATRGQRVMGPETSPDDERWIVDSLKRGPLVVEPELERPTMASIHGVVTPRGEPLLGSPVCHTSDQEVIVRAVHGAIEAEGRLAATALSTNGYFGPFGLDVVISPTNEVHALDLNPRFTLNFSRGMGERRERALEMVWSDAQVSSDESTTDAQVSSDESTVGYIPSASLAKKRT